MRHGSWLIAEACPGLAPSGAGLGARSTYMLVCTNLTIRTITHPLSSTKVTIRSNHLLATLEQLAGGQRPTSNVGVWGAGAPHQRPTTPRPNVSVVPLFKGNVIARTRLYKYIYIY